MGKSFINWMLDSKLDWGYNNGYQNDAIYLVQMPSGEYQAFNAQNLGNFTYGVFAQQLGLGSGQIKLLGHLFNLADFPPKLDKGDDQRAIKMGWMYALNNFGQASKKLSLRILDKIKMDLFGKKESGGSDSSNKKEDSTND